MKYIVALAIALLPVAALAAPVHIALQPASVVQPNAGGFISLGTVAILSGGTPGLRSKLAVVQVGRAPLPGNIRELTPGDLDLKLREAGYQPGTDAVVSGPTEAQVTVSVAPASAATKQTGSAGSVLPVAAVPSSGIVIHPGDPVTIHIDDGVMSITASGTAQSSGAVGDTVHVYRPGCPQAFVATVIDSQNVSLEP